MGSYDGRIYIPDEGEIGWAAPVNVDLGVLAELDAGGGGGGGSLNLIDVTEAPFSADPTGDTFADAALKDAADAMLLAGPGSGLWLPGIFKVKSNLIRFPADAGGYTVAMPPGAKFLIGDDMSGDSLFSALGRHGFAGSDVAPDVDWIRVNVDGNARAFRGDAWGDYWQAQDHSWYRCNVRDLKGSAFSFTGVRRPTVRTARIINCGDASSGASPIDWHHSDEGGLVGRLTEYGTLDDVWVIGSDDFPVQWWLTYACVMRGCKIDQMYQGTPHGAFRSGFLGVDMALCELADSLVLNGYEDCITLKSRGEATSGIDGTFSHDNILHGLHVLGENGGEGGGGFYGIREFAQAGVSHAGNVIDTASIVGTVHRD